jgi:sporadic carbohydrate cluster 2OG-Fe(II) oxygenase
MTDNNFDINSDSKITKQFLDQGYVIIPTEHKSGLIEIQDRIVEIISNFLSIKLPNDSKLFLNNVHLYIDADKINELRLLIINNLISEPWFKLTYFQLAKTSIEQIVGNELAIQRGLGLNIQLPKDKSSLSPLHADVWDGDSPFEVVMWVPLVDCYRSKSMYILNPKTDRSFQKKLFEHKELSAEGLFEKIKDNVSFIEIPFGSILLFTQTLIHGNRVNQENETRWSMNCRFKSLLSPYHDKKLGDFFETLNIKPATRIGMSYEFPGGFDE